MSRLYLFADASTLKSDYEEFSSSGVIAVAEDEDGERREVGTDLEILRWSSNNRGELDAILLAVNFAVLNKKLYDDIYIFSDSKVSVFTLRQWIFNWRIFRDKILVKTDNNQAENQDIIRAIIRTIVHNKLKVRFVHQRGHINPNNITKAKIDFCESNGIKTSMVSDEFISFISEYNNKVDKMSRDYLLNNDPRELSDYDSILDFSIDYAALDRYRELIL